MTQFCALCTDEHGPFLLLTLDGRTYVACRRCADEHPRDGGYSFGGGRPKGANYADPVVQQGRVRNRHAGPR